MFFILFGETKNSDVCMETFNETILCFKIKKFIKNIRPPIQCSLLNITNCIMTITLVLDKKTNTDMYII